MFVVLSGVTPGIFFTFYMLYIIVYTYNIYIYIYIYVFFRYMLYGPRARVTGWCSPEWKHPKSTKGAAEQELENSEESRAARDSIDLITNTITLRTNGGIS